MLAPGLTLHPCGTLLEKDVQACGYFPTNLSEQSNLKPGH